jgi:hypothetical protein
MSTTMNKRCKCGLDMTLVYAAGTVGNPGNEGWVCVHCKNYVTVLRTVTPAGPRVSDVWTHTLTGRPEFPEHIAIYGAIAAIDAIRERQGKPVLIKQAPRQADQGGVSRP